MDSRYYIITGQPHASVGMAPASWIPAFAGMTFCKDALLKQVFKFRSDIVAAHQGFAFIVCRVFGNHLVGVTDSIKGTINKFISIGFVTNNADVIQVPARFKEKTKGLARCAHYVHVSIIKKPC